MFDDGHFDDMEMLFDDIAHWSMCTFGNAQERGPTGPLKHLQKEAQEAIEKPEDVSEYADCLILVFDAAWRAGLTYEDLLVATRDKYAVLQTREYRKVADGEISEHVK